VISVARCPRKKNRERLTRISSLAAIGVEMRAPRARRVTGSDCFPATRMLTVYLVYITCRFFHLDKTGQFRITNRSAVCQIDSK